MDFQSIIRRLFEFIIMVRERSIYSSILDERSIEIVLQMYKIKNNEIVHSHLSKKLSVKFAVHEEYLLKLQYSTGRILQIQRIVNDTNSPHPML